MNGVDPETRAFYVEAYDAIWAAASLHHAQASALPSIFARIRRALVPGGLLSASLKAGEDRRDKFGRFYCAMSAEALAALARDGWADTTVTSGNGKGHDGEATVWLHLDAKHA